MSFLVGTDPGLRQTRTPTTDTFTDGVGFTAGSSTQITLSNDPGTENHVIITFDGVTQHRDTYSQSGAVITFDAAIPTGVSKIEATFTVTVASTTVPDASVNVNKLATSGTPDGTLFLRDDMQWTLPTNTVAGWAYVSSVTASASATVAFTGFSSGYDYRVDMVDVQPATDAQVLYARLGISGPTYRTSGYKGTNFNIIANSPTTGDHTTTIDLSGAGGLGTAADEKGQFELIIMEPAGTGDTYYRSFNAFLNANSAEAVGVGGGFHSTAEAMDAVQFYFGTGNISTGEFKLYRRPNA